MLDNDFVDRSVKNRKLGNNENLYQNQRNIYLNDTDCAIIVFAMNYRNLDPIQILTEESKTQNDGKLFRKIPFICERLDIRTVNSVEYIKQHKELVIEIRK